jgi:ketosteroid isomerase-like protein
MHTTDFDDAVEQWHLAVRAFVMGNPAPNQQMFSHREDVTLMNPVHPVAHGWKEVFMELERASALLSDGEVTTFERVAHYITPELACIVEIERARAKVGARADIASIELRVTTIFRPEEGTWKVVHRHADPITTPRAIESAIKQ